VPAGADAIVFRTFDAPPVANGFSGANELGAAIVNQTIVANTANTLNVTIGGIIARLAVSLSPSNVYAPTSSSVTLSVVGYDADGNQIIADGFADVNGNPVTVQLLNSDTTGATMLGQSSFGAPVGGIPVSYNGALIPGPTITATAGSVTGSSLLIVHGSERFPYVGASPAPFPVPPGITQLTVTAYGAQGQQGGGTAPAQGGEGAEVQATIPVTPGESGTVFVGGQPDSNTPGFNGGGAGGLTTGTSYGYGGGGGGATDLRLGGSDLGSRVIVAAGGGGGAGGSGIAGSGSGGGGGQFGAAGGNSGTNAIGGTGALAALGGVGGHGIAQSGQSGVAGAGGTGGGCVNYRCRTTVGGGGGGGGGYFGGGGGGSAFGPFYDGAGGGGGSSFVVGGASNVTYSSAVQSGNGLLIISW